MENLAPNHIIFAEEWVKDRNGKRAAIAAGFTERSAEVTASRLLRNAKVKAYIDELLAEASKRRKESLDDILNELDDNRKIALSAETPQASAANQATMAKAKLLGYVIDKQEVTGANGGAQEHNHNVTVTTSRMANLLSKTGKGDVSAAKK
jgi:phage terminase small subunit